ncbi:MAG: DUF268 domain-containing protein [Synergistaceae bacterium]|nr:DUF268 domain-containing protein [Synergistaceae bacterium]
MLIKPVIKKFISHPRMLLSCMFKYPARFSRFLRDLKTYNSLNTRPEFHAATKNLFPFLHEWDGNAGSLGCYFWQDLWAARKIFQLRPSEHYDIGSRVDGFIAHVLPFMPVTMIDIRPLPQKVEGLKFIQADATNLDGIADSSIMSLSSLCAPEHFGLGRYGDPVDPEACFAAMKSMQRVLAPGGHLYIAVPVGDKNGVAFNAHRIFAPELVAETLNELELADFTLASEWKDEAGYFEHMDFNEFHKLKSGINYSGSLVGLFEFVKD